MGKGRSENEEYQERFLRDVGYRPTDGALIDLMADTRGAQDLAPDEQEERTLDMMQAATRAVDDVYGRRDAAIAGAAREQRRLEALSDLLERKARVVDSGPGLLVVQAPDTRIDAILKRLDDIARSTVSREEFDAAMRTARPSGVLVGGDGAGVLQQEDVVTQVSEGIDDQDADSASIDEVSEVVSDEDRDVVSDSDLMVHGVCCTRAGLRHVPTIEADAREAVSSGRHGDGPPATHFYRSRWRRRLFVAVVDKELGARGEEAVDVVDPLPDAEKAEEYVESAPEPDDVLPSKMEKTQEDIIELLLGVGNTGMNAVTIHDRLLRRSEYASLRQGYVISALRNGPFMRDNAQKWHHVAK